MPAINNSDYVIKLTRETFILEEDILVLLEIIDGRWQLLESGQYELWSLTNTKCRCEKNFLHDEDIISIRLPDGSKLTLFYEVNDSSFSVFDKYDLAYVNHIAIGKNNTNDIVYDNKGLISREHALIKREHEQWVLEDLSQNGVFINNQRVINSKSLKYGDLISIFGLSITFLENIIAVNSNSAAITINDLKKHQSTDNNIENGIHWNDYVTNDHIFHRSPRKIYRIENETMEIEGPPPPKTVNKRPFSMLIGPIITMALPMLMGSSLAIYGSRLSGSKSTTFMYTGLITAITSALIGTFWAIINHRYEKRINIKEEVSRCKVYNLYIAKISKLLQQKYEKCVEDLNTMYISAQECCDSDNRKHYLWNRNTSHSDFLKYRIGLGDRPFSIEINIPKEKFNVVHDELTEKPETIKRCYQEIHNVPICADLMSHRVVGIVSTDDKQGAIDVMHNIVAQVAVSNCYTDVKLCFVYDNADENDNNWEYLKWLPHTWNENKSFRFFANNKSDISEVLFEITKVLRSKAEEKEAHHENANKIPLPQYIMFVSDSKLLEGELITKYLYSDVNSYITTIILSDSFEKLPNVCEFIIENDSNFKGSCSLCEEEDKKTEVRFDSITNQELEAVARQLADVKVQELETGGDIPAALDFLDMYDVSKLSELKIVERWKKNRTYESMRALIGQRAGGAPWYLDIHEKYHGPHGLIAGTTGSGKSETLQTYILSLAINFSPDDIGFFIIDYKGGGMANLFSNLPHMIGAISNLSGNQVKRAMVSIKSENKRRQRLFNEHGVNNINHYTMLYKNNEAKQPIPHLIIIIDEFAELKREEPEFMRELISVAQVGRSLGVHLILATQKPAGTVDDNIWSNSKFRLCLRVQDRQDSNDMLHRPDAAYITQAGRCYMQVGNDELFELFQSGYSGAAYDENGQDKNEIARLITNIGRTSIIGNLTKKTKNTNKKEKTQLEAVVEYLSEISQDQNFTNKISLWLPILPRIIAVNQLPNFDASKNFDQNGWKIDKEWNISVPIGIYDDPANQAQGTLEINLSEKGHHAIIGTVVSGKSTFLQTLIYNLCMRYSPEWINIYAIDYSAKMSMAFGKMPHLGGIIVENSEDMLSKFVYMITEDIEVRKKLFKGGNYGQYVKKNGVILPAIIICIDNFSNFNSKTNGQYSDFILKLAKEGNGYGIYLVVTAAGFNINEIPTRIGENLRTVICLEMADKFQYADALHTMRIETIPEVNVKGRGLAIVNESILEFQTALCIDEPDDFKRMEEIEQQSLIMYKMWNGKAAKRIPSIPDKPSLNEFIFSEDVSNIIKEARFLPIGYNERNAGIYSIDLAKNYCYIVGGGSRSGKTNLLKVVVKVGCLTQAKITVIDYGAKYRTMSNKDEIEYINSDNELYQFMVGLKDDFMERNKRKLEYLEMGATDEEIFDRMSEAFERRLIIITSVKDFVKHVKNPDNTPQFKPFVENILDKGYMHNVFWFGSLNYDDINLIGGNNIYEAFVKHGKGIHFGGNTISQRVFDFSSISYKEQTQILKLGVGMIPPIDNKSVEKVVIPLAR